MTNVQINLVYKGINTAGKIMLIDNFIQNCEKIIFKHRSGIKVTWEMLTPFSKNFINVQSNCNDLEEGFNDKFTRYFVDTNSRFYHHKSFNTICLQPMIDGIEWLKEHKNNLDLQIRALKE
jgi:hypothetical protein